MSGAKVLEHYAGAWPYHHQAAIRELDRYPNSGYGIDLFTRGEHVSALCERGATLGAVGQVNVAGDVRNASFDRRHLCNRRLRHACQRQRDEEQWAPCVTKQFGPSQCTNHESPWSEFSDVSKSEFSSISPSDTKRRRYLATSR